ncbi:uncharacterized protein MAM_02232 [Metarhizium album ARSEF 1941]|uniref:Uncharacterized protein n=1 Tax=Metarhizium album (strain ARSEF 1941) TaxID=1081103 RepID=A0A0B2X258_METAS|nr:uncharacterized protein MAM_02232 [Metarhizium album ARSEF 1941]KHO00309.1 hypothetical protein MAM_02232 [Metarhizium album ARSEF 1941]
MEDPWSSPWVTDAPAPPTIDLPSEPPRAHYGNSPRKTSPSLSPWRRSIDIGVDDWGGWSVPATGKLSPGWASSPNLKPLESSAGVAPDPWALAVSEEGEVAKTSGSAICVGNDGRADGRDGLTAQIEESSIWERHVEPQQKGAAERSRSTDTEPARSLCRKPVSKVQELVERYDGMAKTSSVGVSSTERAATNEEETLPEVNDCEFIQERTAHLNKRAEESVPQLQAISESTDGRVPSEMALVEEEEGANPNQETTNGSTARSIENKSLTHNPRASPVSYPVDFSSLNVLFPNTQAVTAIPEELPEPVMQECFTSVSQRKAWYRISRFGSARKYNYGNDDNYVRVGWKDSTIRKDTLTTVRRWMEEDSIGGRIVLGRRLGNGGSSMFNWDSKAPPIEIGELLAREKQKPKGRVPKASATREGTVTSPTTASFGWSSSIPTSPATERTSSEWHAKSPRVAETTERDELDKQSVSARVLESRQSSKLSADQSIPAELGPIAASQDEDEDWGDMVSSPTLESTVEFDAMTLSEAASPPTPKPDSERLISKANESNEPTYAFNASTEELDPWGGSEVCGGNNSRRHALQHVPSTEEEAAALKTAPENASSPALPGQPTQDEVICTPEQPSSPTPSRPEGIEPGPRNSQDGERVAAILAAVPDLSYMLR